jgi:hypothetical protein
VTPAERRKLAGVLGKLGSSFPEERDAAACLATELVRKAGVTWLEAFRIDRDGNPVSETDSVAVLACQELLAEVEELRDDNARLQDLVRFHMAQSAANAERVERTTERGGSLRAVHRLGRAIEPMGDKIRDRHRQQRDTA